MNLVEACLKANETAALEALKDMLSRAQPSAIWAILLHAASWHEQRTYDTPHSSILMYAIHRMIEELGPHSKLLVEEPELVPVVVPSELEKHLQLALIQRLTQNLTAVDHYLPERGPRYDVKSGIDSPGNLLRKFTQSIREKSVVGAMEAGIGLVSMDQTQRFARLALSMAAEHPDNLGHGFIMPVSLLVELPEAKYRHPVNAALWHLMEYMVRKVPSKSPEKYAPDDQSKHPAEPVNMTPHKELLATAVVNYGILGHNGIFAHRIAYASSKGLINEKTVDWLLESLHHNIGKESFKKSELSIKSLIESHNGTDWNSAPSAIHIPSADSVRGWFADNIPDIWNAMLDLKTQTFESMIPSIKKKDISLVRAAQYALSVLYGRPKSVHIMIFAQGIWNLADLGIISPDLAMLQVHRMVREYLKNR